VLQAAALNTRVSLLLFFVGEIMQGRCKTPEPSDLHLLWEVMQHEGETEGKNGA
jgi:hypothetical protein